LSGSTSFASLCRRSWEWRLPDQRLSKSAQLSPPDIPRSHDLFDHVSLNFREPFFAPLVQVTEGILIQTELIEDGGVNVAQVIGVFDCVQSDGVGYANRLAPLMPPPASHMEKPRLCIRRCSECCRRAGLQLRPAQALDRLCRCHFWRYFTPT